jgi:hypothetical protein
MVMYQNQLFENFGNHQVSEYIPQSITSGYLSLILRTAQH